MFLGYYSGRVKGVYVLMCEDKCYCNGKWYYNHAQSNLCFPLVL